jgi:hypothetical protein
MTCRLQAPATVHTEWRGRGRGCPERVSRRGPPWLKRPRIEAKETTIRERVFRSLFSLSLSPSLPPSLWRERPDISCALDKAKMATVSKETYYRVKRDLLQQGIWPRWQRHLHTVRHTWWYDTHGHTWQYDTHLAAAPPHYHEHLVVVAQKLNSEP